MRSSSRHARRPETIDGLKIRFIDDPTPAGAELSRALRTLARMLVRGYQAERDHAASGQVSRRSSTLTVVRIPSPHHDTNEAA